jgi:hypothetical protein
MLLNEFIYFNENSKDMQDDPMYDPFHDKSVVNAKDLRKTRLTLRMIHDLRKASDAKEQEHMEEMQLIQTMYKTPEEQPAQ